MTVTIMTIMTIIIIPRPLILKSIYSSHNHSMLHFHRQLLRSTTGPHHQNQRYQHLKRQRQNGMPHGKIVTSTPDEQLLIHYREPPPINSKPEASTLEQKTYTMSQDTTLFQPPPSYPEAPKNMYYQVPATAPEPKKVTQVFPWESRAPKPTRVFADEQPVPAPEPCPPTEETPTPKPTDDFKPSPEIPQRRESFEPSSDSWESYTRSNAWDDDPHIQRYIESIQQARRARTQVISGSSHHQSSSTSSASTNASSSTTVTGQFPGGHRPSIKLTDFPSEVERPSLPVTPAPIRRRTGVPGADDDYPTAEGVPSQEDWVGITADAFSHVLRATYLLWRFTESPGPARGSPATTVGDLGGSRTFAEPAFRC